MPALALVRGQPGTTPEWRGRGPYAAVLRGAETVPVSLAPPGGVDAGFPVRVLVVDELDLHAHGPAKPECSRSVRIAGMSISPSPRGGKSSTPFPPRLSFRW